MSDKELFSASCASAGLFPTNTVRPTTSRHHLEGFYRRLNEHRNRLFCEEGKASLDLWEYHDNFREFRNVCTSCIPALKRHIEGEPFANEDPRSRFIFIHAVNSREKLRVTFEMITYLLTYHQVISNFLDFIFPFGHQHYAEDFHFSGFREDTRLSTPGRGLKIPELGRTGRELRICYSLKSVEPHLRTPDWPWSVRQTALYHSFDMETGKACWMIVKGSNLIRDRIQSVSKGPSELSSFETTASSFASTLATHLVLCDWCDEDWRWYLTFLEKRLQDLTRRAQVVRVPRAPSFVEPAEFVRIEPPTPIIRTLTKKTLSIPKRLFTPGFIAKTQFKPSFPQPAPIAEAPAADGPPQRPPVLPPGMDGLHPSRSANADEIFEVGTLQKVQVIEDKANEVVLNLEANIKIVTSIKIHYQTVLKSEDCPTDLVSGCKVEFAHFQKRIDNILGDLEIQLTSAQVLLRLVQNRKSLLSDLLNVQNIEASKELAKKSQYSAKKMEAMTEAMHRIAVKTKQETVSMRIITLVTLFFLPGTFISVSYLSSLYQSTIMSTDIIKFPSTKDSGEIFQLGALKLYLAITIPMMLVVFVAWAIVYRCVDRRQDLKEYGGKPSGWNA